MRHIYFGLCGGFCLAAYALAIVDAAPLLFASNALCGVCVAIASVGVPSE